MEEGNFPVDSTMKVIRELTRNFAETERKVQRSMIINKKRAALGEIVEDENFTEEFVIAKATALKRKTLPVREYQPLQNALIQNEDNINALLKVDNILWSLARDFSSKDPMTQLTAASVCCNIALGNKKACTALAKTITPYLIAALDSLNYPLLEICAWTVGNLVSGSEKACEILHAQGCLKRIISLLNDCDANIFPSITYAAVHYVYAAFQDITESEIIELIKALHQQNDFYTEPNFIWLLALLSSSQPTSTYMTNILPLVIDYLYDSMQYQFPHVSQITASIRILGNTACEPTGKNANMILQNSKHSEAVQIGLFNELLSHKCNHIRKETLWLLGNLYNHPAPETHIAIKRILHLLPALKQTVECV